MPGASLRSEWLLGYLPFWTGPGHEQGSGEKPPMWVILAQVDSPETEEQSCGLVPSDPT